MIKIPKQYKYLFDKYPNRVPKEKAQKELLYSDLEYFRAFGNAKTITVRRLVAELMKLEE